MLTASHLPMMTFHFMAQLLKREKFRRLLTQQFPVILIDEYQDSREICF
jgi:ATP-dependent exoDNAse (exonuclease V) beta subunit